MGSEILSFQFLRWKRLFLASPRHDSGSRDGRQVGREGRSRSRTVQGTGVGKNPSGRSGKVSVRSTCFDTVQRRKRVEKN